MSDDEEYKELLIKKTNDDRNDGMIGLSTSLFIDIYTD